LQLNQYVLYGVDELLLLHDHRQQRLSYEQLPLRLVVLLEQRDHLHRLLYGLRRLLLLLQCRLRKPAGLQVQP
jgi:hypothetical protein